MYVYIIMMGQLIKCTKCMPAVHSLTVLAFYCETESPSSPHFPFISLILEGFFLFFLKITRHLRYLNSGGTHFFLVLKLHALVSDTDFTLIAAGTDGGCARCCTSAQYVPSQTLSQNIFSSKCCCFFLETILGAGCG